MNGCLTSFGNRVKFDLDFSEECFEDTQKKEAMLNEPTPFLADSNSLKGVEVPRIEKLEEKQTLLGSSLGASIGVPIIRYGIQEDV